MSILDFVSPLLTQAAKARGSYNAGKAEGQNTALEREIAAVAAKRKAEQDALAATLTRANIGKIGAETAALQNKSDIVGLEKDDEGTPWNRHSDGSLSRAKIRDEAPKPPVSAAPPKSVGIPTEEPDAPVGPPTEGEQQEPSPVARQQAPAPPKTLAQIVPTFGKKTPPVPPLADKMQSRIKELVGGGMGLEKASAQARSEYGQAPPATGFTFLPGGDPAAPTIYSGNTKSGELTDTGVGAKAGAAGGIGAAGIKKALAENAESLSVLDDAVKELDAHPTAVGLRRGIPIIGDDVNQRRDPEGIAARAQIANISSLIVHKRSGAAVTVHEFPRLAAFIPNIRDDSKTIRIKLAKLRAAIQVETEALQSGKYLETGGGRAGGGGVTEAQKDWDALAKQYGADVTTKRIGKRP